MYNIILALHVIISLTLIAFILIQRGRSGGLIEALGGVESIFGTKTSSFFVKATVVLAILFFLTSISLAYLSKQEGRSLMVKYSNAQDSNSQAAGTKTQAETNQNESAQSEPTAE